MKYIIFVLAAIFLLVAITAIPETPCTGNAYDGHPALVQECLHQLYVGSNSSYPEPIVSTPGAYPPPNPVVTVIFIGTREPIPTEPPPPTEMP